jgi:hypothetical protein
MKTPWILPLLIFSMLSTLNAQDTIPAGRAKPPKTPKPKSDFMQRTYFGGYLGLQFGSVTFVDISPTALYQVADPFYVGVGLTYQYISDKRYEPSYSTNAYGGSLLARYHIWKDLFAQVEYNPLYLDYYDYYFDNAGNYVNRVKGSTWVHDFLIGAGYRQWLGGRAFMSIAIFYNLNETYYSPYSNPIIRFGFGVGI